MTEQAVVRPGAAPPGPVGTGRLVGRGTALLVGAAVVALLVQPVGPARLSWMPLLVGLTYLVAAAVGGPGAGLWVPGFVVTGWGLAVAVVLPLGAPLDVTATAVVGIGAGATAAAALLPRLGVPVRPLAVPVTVLLIGVFELAEAQLGGALQQGWAWGLVLAVGGVWELRPSLLRSADRPVS